MDMDYWINNGVVALGLTLSTESAERLKGSLVLIFQDNDELAHPEAANLRDLIEDAILTEACKGFGEGDSDGSRPLHPKAGITEDDIPPRG